MSAIFFMYDTVCTVINYPVLYIVSPQAPILLKRDYPFLYIVGVQAPILITRDYPVLYIVGVQAPVL